MIQSYRTQHLILERNREDFGVLIDGQMNNSRLPQMCRWSNNSDCEGGPVSVSRCSGPELGTLLHPGGRPAMAGSEMPSWSLRDAGVTRGRERTSACSHSELPGCHSGTHWAGVTWPVWLM